jgi:hypothetical protein
MTRTQKETAYNMGKIAFLEGKHCYPAGDKSLMNLIKEVGAGRTATADRFKDTAKLCKEWAAGWTLENLRAEVVL